MNQTSVRTEDGAVEISQLGRDDRIAVLRSRMAALGGEPQPSVVAPADLVHVPAGLGKLLVSGGLVRGQAVEMSDCPALVVEIVCDVTARGGQVAIVGWPDLLLAQVNERGDLDNVVVVPDPGADPWSVVGVLVEGLDVVIYHSSPKAPRGGEAEGTSTPVTPTRARPVLAKLRSGTASLLTVGAHLPGSAVTINAQVESFRGIGTGTGRIQGFDIAVQARAKDGARRGIVTCGAARRRLEAV